MEIKKQSISLTKAGFWWVLINLPMIAITLYIHYLLVAVGENYGDNLLENFGLWLLMIFKIGGANLIFWVIISEFKIK